MHLRVDKRQQTPRAKVKIGATKRNNSTPAGKPDHPVFVQDMPAQRA